MVRSLQTDSIIVSHFMKIVVLITILFIHCNDTNI